MPMKLTLAQTIAATAVDEERIPIGILPVGEPAKDLVTALSTEALIEEWAGKLRELCEKDKERNLEGIITKSRLFYAAKASLVYGGWVRMWRERAEHDLPHTLRTGDKYALIGREFGEPDWKYTSGLRACVATLFLLAQPGKSLVDKLIAKGEVDSHLSKGKAERLRNQYRPDLRPKPKPFDFKRWLCQLHGHVVQLELEKVPEQMEAATQHLEQKLTLLLHETSHSE